MSSFQLILRIFSEDYTYSLNLFAKKQYYKYSKSTMLQNLHKADNINI